MVDRGHPEEPTPPSPEEAFAILGNEARFEILRVLGEADEPLGYTALFERLEYDDSSNFSYHLDKLVDHFIARTDEGYRLRRPGERIVEAVLSGAVTSDPVRDLQPTDTPCPFCGSAIEVGYRRERVTMHCPDCSGLLGEDDSRPPGFGNLGIRPLPPAGVQGRSGDDLYSVSTTWTATSMQAIGRGVCPKCSGQVERSVEVCANHDTSSGTCEACGMRFAAKASATCENCIFGMTAPAAGHLIVYPEPMAFLVQHGVDPVAPAGFHPFEAVEETVHSRSPFEATYTFTAGGDSVSVTVDDTLSVVDVTKQDEGEAS